MIRSSVNSYHVSLDTNNAFYQSKLCTLCIQNRSLLNMSLEKMTDRAFFPCGFSNLLRIQSIALHGFINGDAVRISEILGIFYITVSQHGSGSKISGSKTHSFFIAEPNCNKVSLRSDSFFF